MGAPYITGKGFGTVAASWTLATTRQGSACAVDLSDDDAATSWLVVVRAKTPEGDYVLGAVRTRPPRSGDPKARTVCLAWHPGCTEWHVDFYGPRGATARPVLSTSECPGGGVFGVVPANGSRLERQVWAPSPSQTPFAQQGVLSPGPGVLTKAYGFLEPAAAAQLYIGFVDKPGAIVNGDLFIVAPKPVPQNWAVAPRIVEFDFEPDGVPFLQQIRWVVSTSPLAVVLGAPGDVAIVQGERL